MKKRRLAIFDVDGTIYRWSLFLEVVDGLVEEGIFPRKAHNEINKEYVLWLNRKLHYNVYLEKAVETFFKYLKGCRFSDVKRVSKKIINLKKDRVYAFSRDLIIDLKKKKYFLLVISGSPLFIVEEFAQSFKFDQWYGSRYEIKNGVFTGRDENRDPVFRKGKVLDAFLAESKEVFDLKNSTAIGDSPSDIPILERVGKPIAFDPDRDLLIYAKKKNWKIILERKDVIYEVKRFKIIS